MSSRSKFSVKHLLIYALAGVILVGAFIIAQLSNQTPKLSLPRPLPKTAVIQKPVPYFGLPQQIKIPAIGVDASVEFVGLTADGSLGAPKGPSNTAWYDAGPHPGQTGSAVIDGHFGWVGGIPAVFDNLSKLNPGDRVYIIDDKGATIIFSIRELDSFSEAQVATKVFHSSDDKAHLNLITCEGVWNEANQSYSNRLVVFTDKIN